MTAAQLASVGREEAHQAVASIELLGLAAAWMKKPGQLEPCVSSAHAHARAHSPAHTLAGSLLALASDGEPLISLW